MADSGGQPPPMPDGSQSNPSLTKKSFAGLFAQKQAAPQTLIPSSIQKGEPAHRLTQDQVDTFSKPLNLTLIGKFSHGRPTMIEAQQAFQKLNLKAAVQLEHINTKHMTIR